MPSVATPDTTASDSSKESVPPTERQLSATDSGPPGPLNATTAAAEKHHRASNVELKNGKVLFKQKPVSFEKQSETLQEIVKFRAMLEERIKSKLSPLSTFPEEHKSLIAKLAHESDKTLTVLGKHIHHELLPTLDEDEDKDVASATSAALPISLVERAIQDVLVRNNYGIDVPSGIKPLASISVWRWEVKSEYMNWLPKNSREKAESRHVERVQAKEDLKILFETYSQEERNAIVDPKGTHKLPTKELNKPSTSEIPEAKTETGTPQSSKKQGKKKAEEAENDDGDPKLPRPNKIVDPEKAAKEKERLEKKAAKAEREKKDREAHNKSQSIMAKFFAKPKTTPTAAKPAKIQESAMAGPSRIQSDFEKVFKPFVLQKDKILAPTNWFLSEKKRKRRAALITASKDVIVLDSDADSDVEMQDAQPTDDQIEFPSPQVSLEHLNSILSSLPPAATSARFPTSRSNGQRTSGFKTFYPLSVRELVTQLSEAEISGNDDLVRSILVKLSDRELLPAKAFCFHTDARPGYFGTWTRSSRIVGPRTPFAKDTLAFDYAYDSGEEWEEEPIGEDVVEDGEDEDGDGDEPDSDLDSWLVDDDEEPNFPLLGRDTPPPLLDIPNLAQPKRKAEDGERKIRKKRKVVVPLVPFAKGPIFESTIGQCQYDPFKPYAIQLFNDTPLSVDPFTFVSTCIEDYKARNTTTTAANQVSSQSAFAVPTLPPRLTTTANGGSISGITDFSLNTPNKLQVPKKVPAIPKSTFPDVHMPLLIEKFAQLQSASISALVESIHLDLREHKVKKTAIEAKVREVGEKCKDKKVWVIKPALMNPQS